MAEDQVYRGTEQKKRRDALWATKTKLAEVLEQYAGQPAQRMLILTKLLKNIDSVDSGLFDSWDDKERLEEIKKSGRQAFKDIQQQLGECEMAKVNNAVALAERLPELRKKAAMLLKIEKESKRIETELDDCQRILRVKQAQLKEKKDELESIEAIIQNPPQHKNEEIESELKSVEAQIATIQIPAKHKKFKKAVIAAVILTAISFFIYFVLFVANQHKENPYVPTPIELIAMTCFLCFFMLAISLPCFWVVYYNQLEAVKSQRALKTNEKRLKASQKNEQKTFLNGIKRPKKQIQKEHESLLNEVKMLEEKEQSKQKAARMVAQQKHLVDGAAVKELCNMYEIDELECIRVFGPEIEEHLKENSVKAEKSIFFNVILAAVPRDRKIAVIKSLKQRQMWLSFDEANKLVENAPVEFDYGMTEVEAEAAKRLLEGAVAEILILPWVNAR